VRVIAGNVGDHAGPGATHTPITMVHATVSAGARLDLPWDKSSNALVYALAGRGTVGGGGRPIESGQLAVLGAGDSVVVTGGDRQDSRSETLEVLILGGRPIGEPVAHYGPFVMNTRDELIQAFEDFEKGRMGTIPAQRSS